MMPRVQRPTDGQEAIVVPVALYEPMMIALVTLVYQAGGQLTIRREDYERAVASFGGHLKGDAIFHVHDSTDDEFTILFDSDIDHSAPVQ